MPTILGGDIRCPIARSLEVLGDRWTLMIVRDALLGRTRFSEFRDSLGIPRDILTARLTTLVDGGVLERRAYREDGSRLRDEYVLTSSGQELVTVLGALGGWAERHRPAAERTLITIVDGSSSEQLSAALVTADGRVVAAADARVVPV